MNKGIYLDVDGSIKLIDTPAIQGRDWRWFSQQIGCDWIENVYPRGLKEPYMMVVDEEARLKERPVINFLASWLYEAHMHGSPICGNCLIMQQVDTDEGPDIDGIPQIEAEILAKYLSDHLSQAIDAVSLRLGNQLVRA